MIVNVIREELISVLTDHPEEVQVVGQMDVDSHRNVGACHHHACVSPNLGEMHFNIQLHVSTNQ